MRNIYGLQILEALILMTTVTAEGYKIPEPDLKMYQFHIKNNNSNRKKIAVKFAILLAILTIVNAGVISTPPEIISAYPAPTYPIVTTGVNRAVVSSYAASVASVAYSDPVAYTTPAYPSTAISYAPATGYAVLSSINYAATPVGYSALVPVAYVAPAVAAYGAAPALSTYSTPTLGSTDYGSTVADC